MSRVVAFIPDEVGLKELLEMIRKVRAVDMDKAIIFAETSQSARVFARINGFTYVHGEEGSQEESFSKRYSHVRCYEKDSVESIKSVLIKEKVSKLYVHNDTEYKDILSEMDIESMHEKSEGKQCP